MSSSPASLPYPKWLRPVNAINRFLLRKGIALGPPVLLSVPGRRSGRPQTTPVSPVGVGGHQYLVAGFAEADWVKNARVAGWGRLGRGPDLDRVRLVEVPAAERPPIIKEFVTSVRGGRSFIDVPPTAPLAAFAAVADRFPVFRVESDPDTR
jgi:hypothetical protein